MKSKNIELAKTIALLHDIGRFEQIKEDANKIDSLVFMFEILYEANSSSHI